MTEHRPPAQTGAQLGHEGRGDGIYLSGNFLSDDVLNLVQLLGEGHHTGLLSYESGEHTKRVFFLDGVIVAAESTDLRESLGRYLVARNMCTQEDVRRGLEYQRKRGIFLGGALIGLRCVSKEQLREALVGKTEEVVLGLFDHSAGGSLVFEPSPVDPSSLNFVVEMTAEDALWQGEKRRQDLAELRRALGGEGTVVSRTERKPPADLGCFTRTLLDLADGHRSFEDIARESGVPEYWVGTELSALVESGLVERRRHWASEGTPVLDEVSGKENQGVGP